jgi:hypothetical protein
MKFTVTNPEFIKQGTPIQYRIKTASNRINDLERIINEIDLNAEKAEAGLENIIVDLELRSTCIAEIEALRATISELEVEYNQLLVQYSDLGEDILLLDQDRRRKYFRRAVKLANEHFELYKTYYPVKKVE